MPRRKGHSVVSLYEHAEYLRVSDGPRPVQLCVSRLPSLRAEAPRRILLLHGNPSHVDHWRATVPALQPLGEVVAYDEPGFGRSERLEVGRASLERSARLALGVLDAVGWHGKVDVIGQSHGGLVALALAALAPSRVERIVLLGTGGTPAHLAYRLLALPGVARILGGVGTAVSRVHLPDAVRRAVVMRAARDAFSPDLVPREVVDDELHLLATRPEMLMDMALLAGDDPCAKVAQYAARVTSPVLALHGRDDALVPLAYARRLFDIVYRASPESRFVALPGGHMMHLTRPELVSPPIATWLA